VGVCIVQDKERKQVYFHQGQYIEMILRKLGQTAAKPVSTPADLNIKQQKEDGVSRPVDTIKCADENHIGYSDADWAGNVYYCHSTSRNMF